MKISEMVALAGFRSPNQLPVLRQRHQLPFTDGDSIASAGNAFRLVTQGEVARFTSMDEATDVIRSVGDGFRDFWPQIVAGPPFWLIVAYDCAHLAPTDEAISIIGKALHNGSRQRGWPVGLHSVLSTLRGRAEHLGIDLPPLNDRNAWWPRSIDDGK